MNRLLFVWATWALLGSAVAAAEGDNPVPPARLVSIEVALAEFDASLWPAQDAAAGEGSKLLETLCAAEGQEKVYSLTQVRLSALENQQAMAQWGERVAVPAGRTFTSSASRTASGGFAGGTTSYSRESLGTLISAVCRVDESGLIVIELSLEQSRMAADTDVKLDPADPDASALLKPVTKTLKTVVSIADGQTLVLGGMTTKSGKQNRQDAILVTARIIGSKPVKGAARALESRAKAATAAASLLPAADRAPTALPREPIQRASSSNDPDRYRAFAQAMVQRYDANSDGKLDVNEFKAYSRAPANADRDADGIVTVEEIAQVLMRAE